MAGVKVIIVGEVYYADLGVGGGPVFPPAQPPGIWPPPGGMPVPTPPIYYPPVFPAHPIVLPPPGGPPVAMPPIYYPPTVGGGPILPPQPPVGIWPPPGGPVFPAHPIVLPPPSPPGIWPPPGVVSPPIYYPPTVGGGPILPPEPPDKPPEPPAGGGKGQWTYVPGLGWVWYAEGGNWVFVAGDKPRPPTLPEQPPGVQPVKKP
jgi:hypothetical protein